MGGRDAALPAGGPAPCEAAVTPSPPIKNVCKHLFDPVTAPMGRTVWFLGVIDRGQATQQATMSFKVVCGVCEAEFQAEPGRVQLFVEQDLAGVILWQVTDGKVPS